MFRDCGLTQLQFVDQHSYRALGTDEKVENASPIRLSNDFKGNHFRRNMTGWLYTCQVMDALIV